MSRHIYGLKRVGTPAEGEPDPQELWDSMLEPVAGVGGYTTEVLMLQIMPSCSYMWGVGGGPSLLGPGGRSVSRSG